MPLQFEHSCSSACTGSLSGPTRHILFSWNWLNVCGMDVKTISFRQSFGLATSDSFPLFIAYLQLVLPGMHTWQRLSQAFCLFKFADKQNKQNLCSMSIWKQRNYIVLWILCYFSIGEFIGLQTTPLLIWWWGGLTVWGTLSTKLLTVLSPPESLLRIELVVGEKTTGSVLKILCGLN